VARLVNINGHIVPAEQAHVSAYDHGFLYGDGVYETLRTYGGVPFLLDRHLARLRRSAERVRIPWDRLPVDPAEELRKALLAAGNKESLIRLAVTRGVGPFGYDPAVCPRPSYLVYVEEFTPPAERLYREGGRAIIVNVRRNPAVALDPHIKSMNLLNNILASMEAHDRGADEGIMLNLEGNIAEGSNTNVFAVRSGRVLTPPLSAGILEGLTREIVLSIGRGSEIPCGEQDLSPKDLLSSEECFLSGTTKELMPIVQVDGQAIGPGRPGPVTTRLLGLFRDAARRATLGHASR
jgi:branched-chain amino acid aminotransferase